MNRLYSRLHAIRRSRNGEAGSGGRQKAALARLHSARSLNRSQGFTAGCRGSSLAPLGRRSSDETGAVGIESDKTRNLEMHVVNGNKKANGRHFGGQELDEYPDDSHFPAAMLAHGAQFRKEAV